ncbi:hypothetical protein H4219_004855 [Mycoemilia scoparia]|uniref:Uncharacterized protein n=1 Tax=Mycoemilia scoparia TaxID=417184 RepID=A0A9W8DM65_9FUNG|nr:hypothetical protein H4219_004855 [Mycoemilia scoparia]
MKFAVALLAFAAAAIASPILDGPGPAVDVKANAHVKVGNVANVDVDHLHAQALGPDYLAKVNGKVHADALNKAVNVNADPNIKISGF